MRPHGKYAKVDPNNPESFSQCERCGFWRNSSDLTWQFQWSGTHLQNLGILVCVERCLDVPQEQLRTILVSRDPLPVQNARVPNFAYEEQTVRITQYGSEGDPPPWGAGPQMIRCLQNGEVPRILQYTTSS